MSAATSYVLGVDVGTTFTAAALWRSGEARPEVVGLGDHDTVIPSVLLLRPDGTVLVGEAASRRALTEPDRVAREFKRRVGDRVPLMIGGQAFPPHTLVAMLLRRVVDEVARREGGRPAKVVLTCPANWGEYRRQLVTDAAAAAGVQGLTLVSEPVAAAVWYASLERLAAGAVVAVYDLGGGTFDAAVLRKAGDGFELCGEPAGDDSLGGVDFDQVVLEHLAATLGPAWTGLDLTDPTALAAVAQVRAHAVTAKEALSSDLEAEIPVILPGLARQVRLTRNELEDGIRDQLRRTVATLRRAVADAHLRPQDLQAVLLVGGSSRIPLVSGLIAEELGVPVTVDAHPKLAVCLGAATLAAPRPAAAVAPVPGPEPAAEQAPEPGTEPGTGGPEAPEVTEPAAAPAATEAGDPWATVVVPRVAAAGHGPQKRSRNRRALLLTVTGGLLAVVLAVPLTFMRGDPTAGQGTTTSAAGGGEGAGTTILAGGGADSTVGAGTTTTAAAGGGTTGNAGATTTTRRRPGQGGQVGKETTTSRASGGGDQEPTTSSSDPTPVTTVAPSRNRLTVRLTRTDMPVRIISEPGGVDCPNAICSASFPTGARVLLRPHVGQGFSVRMFGGPCGGREGVCTVTMTGSLTISVEPFAVIN